MLKIRLQTGGGDGGYCNKKLITCDADKSVNKMVLRADEDLKKQSSLGETSTEGDGAASKVTTGKSGCQSVHLRRKNFCRQQTCPDVTVCFHNFFDASVGTSWHQFLGAPIKCIKSNAKIVARCEIFLNSKISLEIF